MIAVVWEWKTENDRWLPYSTRVSQLLERSNTRGLVSACLGDADPDLALFTVHFYSLKQRNDATGQKSSVRRSTYAKSACCSGLSWQWADNIPETWNLYEMEVQDMIEEAYQSDVAELNLHDSYTHLPFILNFQAMTQTSRTSGFTRSIRRLQDVPYPLIKTTRQERVNSTRKRTTTPIRDAHSSEENSVLQRTQSTRAPSNTTRPHNYLLRTRSFSGAGNVRETAPVSKTPTQPAPVAPVTAVESKPKKIKPSLSPLKSPVPKAEVAAAASSSSSSAPGQRGKKNKKNKTNMTTSVFIPSLPLMQPDVLLPVPGVKLPSEIQVIEESTRTESIDEMLQEYGQVLNKVPPGEDCSICYDSLLNPSAYGDDSCVISLNRCSHSFHKSCVVAMYNSNNTGSFIQCPTCKIIYGIKVGNQPPGKMFYNVVPHSLPGHADCHSIAITYHMRPGIQGPEHPNPGESYSCRGFPRRGFLPNNEEGRKVLKLLITAWERRLIFTIGTSATTGEEGTVTWNEIHHKTEFGSNYSGHGFPDPRYLENILQELALQGVTETS